MTMSRAEKFQFLIKRLKSYQKTAPKLYDVKNKKTDSKFKINHYFNIFDKLSLEEGWTADYLYFQERIGGEPIIISYPQNKREEYAKKINYRFNTSICSSSPVVTFSPISEVIVLPLGMFLS